MIKAGGLLAEGPVAELAAGRSEMDDILSGPV